MTVKSKKARAAARDEECTLNIIGVCNYNPETTVFCHFPDESNGLGKKPDDVSGGFCCSACHDAIDMRSFSDELEGRREWYLRRSMVRTWRRLIEKGVVKFG